MRVWVVACLLALATSHVAGQGLGDEAAAALLGEWVLQDFQTRVPVTTDPNGVSYMTGKTMDNQMKVIASNPAYLNKDDLSLSYELQNLITTADAPNFQSSSFVIVAANPSTGSTLGYNNFNSTGSKGNTKVNWKRNMGYSWLMDQGEIEAVIGEQVTPASWRFHFKQDSTTGLWSMHAMRIMPYQIVNANNTVTEKQSILTTGPYTKTNRTLSALIPEVVAGISPSG